MASFEGVLTDESKKATSSQSTLREAFGQIRIAAQVVMQQLANHPEMIDQQGQVLEEATKRLIDKYAYIDAWVEALDDLKKDRSECCHVMMLLLLLLLLPLLLLLLGHCSKDIPYLGRPTHSLPLVSLLLPSSPCADGESK